MAPVNQTVARTPEDGVKECLRTSFSTIAQHKIDQLVCVYTQADFCEIFELSWVLMYFLV